MGKSDSLSSFLSFLVIVTVLTKALIEGSWLLSMCRLPGCQGNQSKVVSKRRHRALQCSRKTAAQACTQSDGIHSRTNHDTRCTTALQTLRQYLSPFISPSLPVPPEDKKKNPHSSSWCVGGLYCGCSLLTSTSHLEIRVRGTPRVNTCCPLCKVAGVKKTTKNRLLHNSSAKQTRHMQETDKNNKRYFSMEN